MEFLKYVPLTIAGYMAGPAVLTGMSAGQFKPCPGMVKPDLFPAVLTMTYLAVSAWIEFRPDKCLVYIFMAVFTFDPDIPETPLFLLLMAFKTGNCIM